jgi:CysZ protein
MGTKSGLFTGLGHMRRGFGLIVQPRVRRFVIIPLTINVGIFLLALWGLVSTLDTFMARYLVGWPEWLHSVLWLIGAAAASLLVFLSFSIVANIVASPFNGLLATAVEAHLNGTQSVAAMSSSNIVSEIARSMIGESRKLIYIALRSLLLLGVSAVLAFVPVINLALPWLWFLFGAWMLTLEYLDCPLTNHGQLFPVVLEKMREHRAMAFGFGSGMTVMTLIPGLNFIAMPVGVAGATSMYCAHFAARP